MIHLAENWAEEVAADCNAATSSICISSLSMLPPRTINNAAFSNLWLSFCAAANRGVQVLIYLPAPTQTHPATLQNSAAANKAHYSGMSVKLIGMPRLLHAKSIIIDDSICWIGSGNMTAAAAHHNHELYCRFVNHDIAARIQARWRSLT